MSHHANVPTPWGRSQSGCRYGPGMVLYECADHGGFKITKPFNRLIPPAFRNENGWYEEDCEAAIPFYFLFEQMRRHCLTYGLEGNSMGAEAYFARFDQAHFRGTLERYFAAECTVHFGREYADEELHMMEITRAQHEAAVAAVRRKIAEMEAQAAQSERGVSPG